MTKRLLTVAALAGLIAFVGIPAVSEEGDLADEDRAAEEREERAKRRARALLGEFREGGAGLVGTNVTDAPFSADYVFETVQKLEDGNRIERTRRVRVYRDSQGRTREEFLGRRDEDRGASSGLVVTYVAISDPKAREFHFLNPRRKTFERTTGPWPERERERDDDRGERDEGPTPTSLGKRNIEGVEADGTRRTRTIAAGRVGNQREIRIVSERWYSPELQLEMLTTHSDPRRGTRTRKLTNVQRIEPLPALFEPPPDYKPAGDDDSE